MSTHIDIRHMDCFQSMTLNKLNIKYETGAFETFLTMATVTWVLDTIVLMALLNVDEGYMCVIQNYIRHIISLLKELILVRDSSKVIDGFNYNEICEMIDHVSTSFI